MSHSRSPVPPPSAPALAVCRHRIEVIDSDVRSVVEQISVSRIESVHRRHRLAQELIEDSLVVEDPAPHLVRGGLNRPLHRHNPVIIRGRLYRDILRGNHHLRLRPKVAPHVVVEAHRLLDWNVNYLLGSLLYSSRHLGHRLLLLHLGHRLLR